MLLPARVSKTVIDSQCRIDATSSIVRFTSSIFILQKVLVERSDDVVMMVVQQLFLILLNAQIANPCQIPIVDKLFHLIFFSLVQLVGQEQAIQIDASCSRVLKVEGQILSKPIELLDC